MKTMMLFAVIILSAFLSCTSNKSNSSENVEMLEDDIQVGLVENYFALLKPGEPMFFVIKDQAEFDRNFHQAKTMTNIPTPINFEKSVVGAIVLPVSEYDTSILVDTAYIKDYILHIKYNVLKGEEARSFSSIPQVIFTIDSSLAVDSVVFDSNNLYTTLPF